MIQLIQQPPVWSSAYDDIVYRLSNIQKFYTVPITASTTMPQYMKINIYGQFDVFKIGLEVRFPNLFPSGPYTIIGYEGNSAIITMGSGPLSFSEDVWLYKTDPIVCKLHVGYIQTHPLFGVRPIAELTKIQAIYKNGEYRLNVSGFLQDCFTNIKHNPVTGPDKILHIQYQLYASEFNGTGNLISGGVQQFSNGLDYKLGDVRNCLNGCVDNLNSSQYITEYGSALQEPFGAGVIKQNNQDSIYSYIIDDQVITAKI